MAGPIAKVLKKLDALDGVIDRHYTNTPLYDSQTPAGICKKVEDLKATLGRSNIVAGLKDRKGRMVTVDCAGLAMKLKRLVGIANKLPAFKPWMSKARSVQAKRATLNKLKKIKRADDHYAPFIVDQMITLLLGIPRNASRPIRILFGVIPSGVHVRYSAVVRIAGKKLHKPPKFQKFKVTNTAEAYKVFKRLGKRYKFKTSDFIKPKVQKKKPRSRP